MPSAYLKLVVQAGEAAGYSTLSLLAGTGLTGVQLLQSDQPVSFEATLTVLGLSLIHISEPTRPAP